jgi:S1-C subfamily serine protease
MHPEKALLLTTMTLGVGLAAAFVHASELAERVNQLETHALETPGRIAGLERRAEELEGELRRAEAAVEDLSHSAARQREVASGLRALQAGLEEAVCRIEEQRAEVLRFTALEEQIGPQALERRFAQFGASVEQRWMELGQLAANAERLAESAREGLEIVERELEHDPDGMWNHLLGPTVQVSGSETVGTGVLVASTRDAGDVLVLTAWHVIRDLFEAEASAAIEVPVAVYAREGGPRHETARLLEHDAALDVALLRLEVGAQATATARLAPRARLKGVRVFDRVYAVGCPLGNDPIPTFGEIADVRHVIDGQGYWMVSAPTYIGNSGGGIFDAGSHELLALFTKIYTHGTVRPAVVTHMGLATPLSAVYDWLDRVGYGSLEPGRAAQPQTAAATNK